MQTFITIITTDPIVYCASITCPAPGVRNINATGSMRFFAWNGGAGVVAGNNSGTFFTDPRMLQPQSPGQPGAIQQYVKAGLRALLPPRTTDTEAYDVYGFGRPYIYGGDNKIITSLPTAREGSLSSPN